MEITNNLINILKELPRTFIYEGETYYIDKYGDASMNRGRVEDCYVYWGSSVSQKRIRMNYRLKSRTEYLITGIQYIQNITFWENYKENNIYDEWERCEDNE